MLVACAWCAKSLGEKPPLEDTRTSHGICPECLARLKADTINHKEGKHDQHIAEVGTRIQGNGATGAGLLERIG
jgi:hypothetical protein